MKTALVLSRSFPYSAQRVHGIYQRLGTQVEALGKVVDRVDCLFFVPTDEDCTPAAVREHEARLRRLWSPAIALRLAPTIVDDVPKSRWQRIASGVFDFHAQLLARPTSTVESVATISAALDARPDIILVHRLDAMSPLLKIARQTSQKLHEARIFFDMDDIEHVASFRRLLHDPAWPAQRLLLLQLPALTLAEIRAVRLAAATFVCSDQDRSTLARLARGARVLTVPNSVAFPPLADGDLSESLLLFVGTMGYRPNAQAVDSLVQQVWPIVRARLPAARLAIVGPGPERTASYHAAHEGVTFTGFVDDLEPWYRRARVVCCPIYHGGGTRVKIIEAAAHRKAIVATHLAAEGLQFADGHEIILRDAASELAAACLRLLAEPGEAARLGRAALHKARGIYERTAVVDRLAAVFREGCTGEVRRGVPA